MLAGSGNVTAGLHGWMGTSWVTSEQPTPGEGLQELQKSSVWFDKFTNDVWFVSKVDSTAAASQLIG
jgi:hypothetical protein